MDEIALLFAVVPGVILFLFGIENFSKEVQRAAGERFRSAISKITKKPVYGALLGAAITSIIQSSTATTTITVGLVNSGIISFTQSLGIILGSNLGTTVTAQLVAFKLTSFGPIFIIVGFLLSIVGGRYKFIGKPIFYFGLVFFSLNFISDALNPFKSEPQLLEMLTLFDSALLGILAGFLFTNIVQSSSVTTGIVVLLASEGMLSMGQGIPLILGANIGTTVTALLASLNMNLHAKRAAASHILFNLIGVLMIIPFIGPFEELISWIGGDAARQIANAHLIFNLSALLVFLLVFRQFEALVRRIVPGTEKEILLHTKHLEAELPQRNADAFSLIEKEIINSMQATVELFDNSISMLKSFNDEKMQKVTKLETLNDFLDQKISAALISLSNRRLTEYEARRIVLLVRISNVLERIGDNAEVMAKSFQAMDSSGFRFSDDAKTELNDVYQRYRDNFKILISGFPEINHATLTKMKRNSRIIEKKVIAAYALHIVRLKSQKAYSGSVFVDAISTLDSAESKLVEIGELAKEYSTIKNNGS